MRFDEETTPLQWGTAIALSLGAAALISTLFGYSVGAPTVGLAAVIVSTLGLLRAMARLVTSMSSEEMGLEFVSDDGRSARAWREEKKRSLRAIQELKLDYALHKIGDKDYQAILSQYEARALAAMNALDAKSALHPALSRDLERYAEVQTLVAEPGPGSKQPVPVQQAEDASSEVRASTRVCGACGETISDPSARFCQACGKELA